MAAMFLGRRQITPTGGTRGPAWDDHVATTPWIGGNHVMTNGGSQVTSPTEERDGMTQWRSGRDVTKSREERHMRITSGISQVTSPRRDESMATKITEERNIQTTSGKGQMNAPWRGEKKVTATTEERNVVFTTGKSQVIAPTPDSQGTSSWQGGRKVITTTEETHVTTVTAKSQVFAATGKGQVAPPRRVGRQITTTEEKHVATSADKSQVNPPWRGQGGKMTTTTEERNVTKTTGKRQVALSSRVGKPVPSWLSGKKESTSSDEENIKVTTEKRQMTAAPKVPSRPTSMWREERKKTAISENQMPPTPAERKKVTSAFGEKKVITTHQEEKVLTEIQNTSVDFHRLASPHLAKSEVLKMLTEQEQSHHGYHDHHGHHVQQMDWPPAGHDHPASFFTAIETNEVKKVAWPPVEPLEDGDQPLREYQAVHSVQRHKNSPPPPSTMALRQEIPLRQPPQEVYQSTPTAKKNPKPWRGDLKWPPEYCREVPEELQPKKEIVKPKRQRKDYTSFFAAHELPNNYPGYRVPPGTQYYGAQGGTPGHSDM